MSRLLYLGSQFFIELLLSVSRLLYLGSQFFIELLLSVEQDINRALQLTLICLFRSTEVNLTYSSVPYVTLARTHYPITTHSAFTWVISFFIKQLLSVSRLLCLGSQFFIELLLSVEQDINRKLAL